ncbi:MAG: NADH-quinone oxidoreductase subunit NuoF [Clostridia bacterium]|nr:NADH-quinone oxidoreductase subunit NuoF [Clostridia bacterium]
MVKENRVVLRNHGELDPLKIDEYIARDGYNALKKAFNMGQDDVIEEVKASKLRGRGGAGFSCGLKWLFTKQVEADQKYVVCNADEGEPGTYKDRMIMQYDPHTLIEGMAICGYAVGADKGYIYCRGEYPYILDILNTAIGQAAEKGLLGDFSIEVRYGAGAYVCGEETALLASLEGKRGEPSCKPPYPTVEGVWKKPTVVNNVETFASVPSIINKGAEWYSSIGDPDYPGTKILTLSGDVNNTTFFEVPTDTTLREVIFGLGGGMKDGKAFKAAQVGGNSGAFVPESLLDTPIAFDSMESISATLGSGAVFVLDETRDIVDVSCRVAGFFVHESCGKCAPCRIGTTRIHEIIERIGQGRGNAADLVLLKDLGSVMAGSCLCGLGQAAPVPILSVLKHFAEDYDAAIARAGEVC